MFSIRLPKQIEADLSSCSEELHQPKSKIVADALALYLEDLQDYIRAKKIIAKDEPTVTHEELKREFGL